MLNPSPAEPIFNALRERFDYLPGAPADDELRWVGPVVCPDLMAMTVRYQVPVAKPAPVRAS